MKMQLSWEEGSHMVLAVACQTLSAHSCWGILCPVHSQCLSPAGSLRQGGRDLSERQPWVQSPHKFGRPFLELQCVLKVPFATSLPFLSPKMLVQHQRQTAILEFSYPSPCSLKEVSHSKLFFGVNLFQHFLLIGANLIYEPKGSGPSLFQTPSVWRNQILAVSRGTMASTPMLQEQQLDNPCLSEARQLPHSLPWFFTGKLSALGICWHKGGVSN